MLHKLVDAFVRVRPGFVVAAAASVLAVVLAFSGFTATPIADISTAIDLGDPATDVAAILLAVLLLVLVIWGLAVGTYSVRTHSFRHFAK